MNRNEMQYPPPIELETEPLKGGETVELWNAEIYGTRHSDSNYYEICSEVNTGMCWTRGGVYNSNYPDSKRNVRRVISRAQPEPVDPDAWKKTPEAVAAWSSCYDMEVLADLMYYTNSGGYHIDPSVDFGSFADKKIDAMHERGLL